MNYFDIKQLYNDCTGHLDYIYSTDNSFTKLAHDISNAAAALNYTTHRHPVDDLIETFENPAVIIEQYGIAGRPDDENLSGWLFSSSIVILKIVIQLVEERQLKWNEAVNVCVSCGIFDICASAMHDINAQSLEKTFNVFQRQIDY